jgi:broad specificity phosphatase PhoE
VTRLFLVRHGQTVGNVQRVWQGWTEGELTSLGVQQAKAAARGLAAYNHTFDALYSSPLRRAWQTAEIVGQALGLSPLAHEGLKEIWFGEIEGVTLEEFAARYPETHRRWSKRNDVSFTWPGGENRAEFQRRARRAIEDIAVQHKGRSVVVVAHGGTLRAILAHLFPIQLGQWWSYSLANCSLTRVWLAPDGPQLLALNDQSHLDGLTSEDTWVAASTLTADAGG